MLECKSLIVDIVDVVKKLTIVQYKHMQKHNVFYVSRRGCAKTQGFSRLPRTNVSLYRKTSNSRLLNKNKTSNKKLILTKHVKFRLFCLDV